MSKPTLIFVPGAWHAPSVFSRVISLLSTNGYTSHGLSLPSVGANPGLPNFDADVAALQTLIDKSISVGEDVIVVLWSYAGVVGTEAVLPSMLKSNREAEGKRGGVIHLVYLAAPALKVGMSVGRSNPDSKAENAGELAVFDEEAGIVTINPKFAPMLFYNDVEDQELVKELVDGMQSMSVGALRSKLTRAAWEYAPATSVICEKDFRLPAERAERQLKEAKELCPGAFQTIERCEAGHVPFVSMPERVVEILRRAAGEVL